MPDINIQVLRWLENLTEEENNPRSTVIKVSFIVGGTTGPARQV